MKCIFTNRTIGMTFFSIGTKSYHSYQLTIGIDESYPFVYIGHDCFAHTRDSADPRYKLLEILKLEKKNKNNINKIMNKDRSIPDIISHILPPASGIRRYNTRFASKLKLFAGQISTNSEKSSFKFAVSKKWELCPLKVKRLSFISFKKAWKWRLWINQSLCWLDAE